MHYACLPQHGVLLFIMIATLIIRTVAELIGDHSKFLKLEIVIFFIYEFKDNYYAYNPYMCMDCKHIVVIFK